jgi:hypothetical protein
MRIFFVSTIALISIIQGCSGDQSLNVPSVFAVRKTKHPASTAVFGIARGGAVQDTPRDGTVSVVSKTGAIVGGAVAVSPKSTTSDFIADLFSPKKIGWTISLAINLIYLFFYFFNQPPRCGHASAGFCVTNLNENQRCPDRMNSHTWAFIVDCIFTVVGLKAKAAPEIEAAGPFMKYGLVFTIFSHGLLHGVLGLLVSCTDKTFDGAVALFGAFSVLISYFVVFASGNLTDVLGPILGQVGNIALGLVAGWLCVQLSGENGENGVSSIFLITQLLATAAATLFPKGDGLNPKLGLSFIPPCLISLIELVYCCDPSTGGASLFNKLGGHVWYDVFLHTSVLIALIDGPTGKKPEEV